MANKGPSIQINKIYHTEVTLDYTWTVDHIRTFHLKFFNQLWYNRHLDRFDSYLHLQTDSEGTQWGVMFTKIRNMSTYLSLCCGLKGPHDPPAAKHQEKPITEMDLEFILETPGVKETWEPFYVQNKLGPLTLHKQAGHFLLWRIGHSLDLMRALNRRDLHFFGTVKYPYTNKVEVKILSNYKREEPLTRYSGDRFSRRRSNLKLDMRRIYLSDLLGDTRRKKSSRTCCTVPPEPPSLPSLSKLQASSPEGAVENFADEDECHWLRSRKRSMEILCALILRGEAILSKDENPEVLSRLFHVAYQWGFHELMCMIFSKMVRNVLEDLAFVALKNVINSQ